MTRDSASLTCTAYEWQPTRTFDSLSPSTIMEIIYMRDMNDSLCRAIPNCTSMGLHSFEGFLFRPWIRTLVGHQTGQQQVHNPLPGISVPPCLYLLPRCICYLSSPKGVGSPLKCPPRYTTPVPPLYRFVPPVMRRIDRGTTCGLISFWRPKTFNILSFTSKFFLKASPRLLNSTLTGPSKD